MSSELVLSSKNTQKSSRHKPFFLKTRKLKQYGGSSTKALQDLLQTNPEVLKYLGVATIGLGGVFLLWIGYVKFSPEIKSYI
jgi:hypothetical protein